MHRLTHRQAKPMLSFTELLGVAQRSSKAKSPCQCAQASLAGWESLPLSFPESQLREAGTLRGDAYEEPTFAEYHPAATTYWSPLAPIAPRYFPYNRCSVWECGQCGRCYLRYTESGGYY